MCICNYAELLYMEVKLTINSFPNQGSIYCLTVTVIIILYNVNTVTLNKTYVQLIVIKCV